MGEDGEGNGNGVMTRAFIKSLSVFLAISVSRRTHGLRIHRRSEPGPILSGAAEEHSKNLEKIRTETPTVKFP